MKRALICGVSGQDGAYLARLLLEKGYEVYGTSRDAEIVRFEKLARLEIRNQVSVCSMSPNDFRSVISVLAKVSPEEVYNLSGQSSVGLSFEQPVETMESVSIATLNFLEAIRFLGRATKFYNASSGECFGDANGVIANESTPFRPRSPYGVAKAAAFWQVANYREAYGLHACSGILFNHESPLRPGRFVTQKIVTTVCRIAGGSKEKLRLGNIDIQRDWGWAPEYVEAMWLMLQATEASDYIIATGESHSLKEFVQEAFETVGLDWKDHVEIDAGLFRPTELMVGRANPRNAMERLGWRPRYKMKDVVRAMINDYQKDDA